MSRRPPNRRPAVVLIAVVLAAACASAPPREQLVLSSWQPPPVQECRVSSTEPLRVGKLADSMALAAAVEAPYLRFRPALNDRERVSVWIEIPVTLYFRASDEDPPPPS